MRPDLERIAAIERYIDNAMTAGERAAFEAQLNSDPKLQEDLQLQRDLMVGISRGSLKANVRLQGRRYHTRRLVTRAILGGLAGILVVGIVFFAMNPAGHRREAAALSGYDGTSLPSVNEEGRQQWALADSVIAAQVFNIDADRDTVLSTQGGIVLAIPGGSFQTSTGETVSGKISLCIKEALDAGAILKAGLSTMADGKLLETGGMFFVDARNGEGILKFNPEKPLFAEVPAIGNRADMMLFKGRRLENGGINWTDPKPLPKDLVAVDIGDLDFYPPEYLPALAREGYRTTDRRFTDSIYYSLAALFGERRMYPSDTSSYELEEDYQSKDSSVSIYRSELLEQLCGINPAKIKTLRSGKFENTLIATREFEQRLRLIHAAHSHHLLELYVNNPDRNLYEIDSMAAATASGSSGAFAALARSRLGNVRKASVQAGLLKRFYARQSKLFADAIIRTQQELADAEASRDRMVMRRRAEHAGREQNRSANMFAGELWKNMNSAYRQLGYQRAPDAAITAVAANALRDRADVTPIAVNISSPGWYNVDKYVNDATVGRQSMDYVDPKSGRTASIRYEPVEIHVADAASYDRLLVYLLPDGLSSFMRLNGTAGKYAEKLNMLMKYDLVCLAYRGNERFILTERVLRPQVYAKLALRPVDSLSFERELRAAKDFGTAMSLQEDAAFERLQLIYAAELKRRSDWRQLLFALEHALFPCLDRLGRNTGSYEFDVNRNQAAIPDADWMQ